MNKAIDSLDLLQGETEECDSTNSAVIITFSLISMTSNKIIKLFQYNLLT